MFKLKKLAALLPLSLALATTIGCKQVNESPSSLSLTASSELNFSITEGNVYNQFYRQDTIAAHSLFSSGYTPRIVVAFPAGNSGVSLWFAQNKQAVSWQQVGQTKGAIDITPDGESLRGVSMQYQVDGKQLVVEQAILGSVRVIRDYVYSHQVPKEMRNQQTVNQNRITWYRDRLDGQGGYKLSLAVENGTIKVDASGQVRFIATGDAPMQFNVLALSGDKPLTPITRPQLLKHIPDDQSRTAKVLAYLSYQEKMMAGSWRFQTYFGRDTLLSLAMLMSNMRNDAIEAGLSSVIERLSAKGEVAHEEDIGELALLRRIHAQKEMDDTAVYDYKMIDDNYLLSIVVAQYLLDDSVTKQQAKAFLQRTNQNGERYLDVLLENFKHVIQTSTDYANKPSVDNLIRLQEGEHFGEWRDSHEGLGYGRIPYNVNAIFVPAALQAIVQLKGSGLLDIGLIDNSVEIDSTRIKHNANVWLSSHNHFKVDLTPLQANEKRQRYLEHRGLSNAIADVKNTKKMSFYAVSLTKDGTPVPIINSDIGFALLFAKPTIEQLNIAIDSILAPYPQGLLSPVGLMVASSAYTESELYPVVTNNHYHGEVVWSWQQALFAAGLNKQLARSDLSANMRDKLQLAKDRLWQVIDKTERVKEAELWTWQVENQQMVVQPFGQQSGNKTESNAAQLWSTVYLAIEQ